MSANKILQRIQLQIDELTPTLELFVDDTIQPSVNDCENLQKQLTALQENIAVYKYNKQNKEISPSFNIHARLSEKEEQEAKKAEIVTEIKETVKLEKEEKTTVTHLNPEIHKTEAAPTPPVIKEAKTEAPSVSSEMKSETPKQRPPLAIGINDKFRFMNDLFAQNSSEYNIALEQLNNVTSWSEAEIYLNSLKNVYDWDEKEEVVKYFFAVIKKRFD